MVNVTERFAVEFHLNFGYLITILCSEKRFSTFPACRAKQIRDLSELFTTQNGWSMMGIKGSVRRAMGDDVSKGAGKQRDTYIRVCICIEYRTVCLKLAS